MYVHVAFRTYWLKRNLSPALNISGTLWKTWSLCYIMVLMKRSGEMAQYTVLKVYTDKQLGKTLKVEDVVEYTDERFLEVNGFLKQFGGGYLRKVESQKKSRKTKVVEEEVVEETTAEETEE